MHDVQVANRGLVCYSNSHLQVVDVSHYLFQSTNIFNHLPDLAPMSLELCDKFDHYIAADIEDVKDPPTWWRELCKTFPHPSLMAHDYLAILGKSTNFSSLNLYLQSSSYFSSLNLYLQSSSYYSCLTKVIAII
jgi:hypothetical protein